MTGKNKQFFEDLEQDRAVAQLIKPSWISGLTALVDSLVIVLGTIVAIQYRNSNFHYLAALQTKPEAVTYNYNSLNSGVSGSTLISNLPLAIFWGGAGLVAYWGITSILRAFKTVNEIEQELDYVHANRQKIIRQAVGTVLVRLFVLIVWFIYLQVTIHFLIPYAIAVAYAASGALSVIKGVGFVVWGISLLTVVFHLHVILLRLLFLRPRLFGSG